MHNTPRGLYIHIPFCEKKCAYCDFYSSFPLKKSVNEYVTSLKREIKKWGGELGCPIDTIYIGGGTPSLLGGEIISLIECVRDNFKVLKDAEITVEINPSSAFDFLEYACSAGVNRISIGVQSGSDATLKTLGRTHTVKDSINTVNRARELGFDNISVDLMIGLPQSCAQTLNRDIDFIISLMPDHISSYILKVEENTAFAKIRDNLNLPDDDQIADQYLYMCDCLKRAGFEHYEISNFARFGKHSRHNLKYWRCGEYLGLGASAHSYINGERFYYPRDLKGYINAPQIISEGSGGTAEEKFVLGIRLSEGVDLVEIFGRVSDDMKVKIQEFEKHGYINAQLPHISLTERGMLISNSIITELLL